MGITKGCIVNSLNAYCADFEDAVQIATAQEAKADCIITRDAKHFADSPIPVYIPVDFLQMLP